MANDRDEPGKPLATARNAIPASDAVDALARRGGLDLAELAPVGDETDDLNADLFARLRAFPLGVDPLELFDAAKHDMNYVIALQRQQIADGDAEKKRKLRETTGRWRWAYHNAIPMLTTGLAQVLGVLIEIHAQSLVGENSDEQIGAYRDAIELGMTRPSTWWLLGQVHHNRKEWQDAVSCFARCFVELKEQELGPQALQGDYGDLHIAMAFALDELGASADAVVVQAHGLLLGETTYRNWNDFHVYLQKLNRRDIRDEFRRLAPPDRPNSRRVEQMLHTVIRAFGSRELVELVGYDLP